MTAEFESFTRQDASETELAAAVERLGAVQEAPSLWSGFANDPALPALNRSVALCQLIRRHVHPGAITVGEFAAMLDGADWLAAEDVRLVHGVFGKMPVSWSPDDTTAVMSLPGGCGAIYLAIAGRFAAEEIAAALRGKSTDEQVLEAVIREAGVSRAG